MRKIKIKERILALLLAVVLAMSGIVPMPGDTAKAADEVTVRFELESGAGDFSVKVYYTDDSENAITSKTTADDESYIECLLTANTTYNYVIKKTGYEDYEGTVKVEDSYLKVEVPEATNTEPDGMKLAAIELDTTDVSLVAGKSKTVTIKNKIAEGGYTWKSSNEKIATVSGGKITAVGYDGNKNEAVITVTGPDKTTTAEVNVKVSKADSSVSLTATPDSTNNATSIECVAKVPSDATGTIDFYANGTKFAEKKVSNGEATVTYSDEDKILGGIEFKAVYSGDEKYNGSEKSTNGTYTKSTPLVFADADAKTVIREDADDKSFDIEVEDTKVEGRTLKFESDNTSVATVDEDGKVTIIAPGKADITVTANAGGNYVENKATYTVIVQKVITVDEITWNTVSRVYNGTTDVTITGILNADGVEINDEVPTVKVTYKAVAEDKNVGTKDVELVEFVNAIADDSKDVKEYFAFDIDKATVKNVVNITQRKVYLATKDSINEYKYNDKINEVIKERDDLVCEDKVVAGADEGTVENEPIEITKATVENKVFAPDEIHKNVIKPYIINDETSNYYYVETTEEENLGDLQLEKANLGEDIYETFECSSNTNTLYQDKDEDEVIWVQSGKVFANIKASEEEWYDSVVFKVEEKEYNLTEGYEVKKAENESYSISGNIYLQKDGKQVTEVENFTIKIDQTKPIVKFEKWEEAPSVIGNLLSAIKFERYAKSNYSVNTIVEDTDSGLKSWYYHVYKVEESEDQSIDDKLTKDALIEYEKTVAWKEGTNQKIPILEGLADNAKEYQGCYIVLIKAVDNVNNSVVYASNGIVFDVEVPVITIYDASGKDTIDSTNYYNSAVGYSVKVSDPNKNTTSGLENVVIQIKDGDEIKDTIDVLKDDGYTYSYKELCTLAEKEYVGEVDYDSNNLKIVVTADDQSGNQAVETTQSLMIDKTSPEIKVSYDNNTVKNDKYFDASRTMTIEFKEKNFDAERVTFDVLAGVNIDSSNPDKGISLSGLSDYGITYEWGTDSEKGKNVSTYTDNRKNTLILKFETDNEYYILPHCKDKANNEEKSIEYADGTVCKKEFVIDTTKPVINVKYTEALIVNADEEAARVYTQDQVTATVTITETNFQLETPVEGQFDMTNTTVSKAAEEAAKEENVAYVTEAHEKWDNGNGAYEKNFIFKKDANYTFGFTYTDLAGNSAIYDTRYFTVDDTDPEGTIKLDGVDLWQQIINVLTFNWFKNNTYNVTLTSEDATAGVDTIAYYTTADKDEVDENTDMSKLDWTTTEGDTASFDVAADEQFIVYGRVIDKSGNYIYLSTTDGAVAEDNAPKVSVKETSRPANGQGIYDGAIPLEVTATDADGDGVENSGIEKIWYTITADVNGEKVSAEGTLYDKNSDVIDKKDIKVGQGEESVTRSFEVPTKFNSNNIHVTVYARDVAGTEGKDEIDLKMDTTNPTVNVDPPLVKGYYNETVGTTIKVTERNFDEANAHLSITNTDGNKAWTGSWKIDNAGKYDSAVSTRDVEFREDGDYVMTFYCIDKAGRKSNEYTSPVVTIDKTKPVIQVSYDNNNAENGNYYDAPRTATVTIIEHNFNAKDVKFDTNGSVSGWKSNGDRHTATVRFSSDNDYYFDIDYTDLAGNAAADYTRDEFTVDLTNPTVEITGVADRSANKGTVAPVITIHDTNFDANRVEITLTGANRGKVDIGSMASVSTSADGRTIRFSNFPEGMDDVYTLTAKAIDKAGNETTKTILFSVNRDGSTYKVNDYTKKLIDKGYTNDPQDIVIVETNVDTLTFIELSYTKDGKIVVLKEGKDYKIGVTGGEGTWKQYTYTIFASAFEEEGKYNINISSIDRAKNESNNKVQSMTIEFVVDKTVPTMVISNLENRGVYKTDAHEFILNVKDNTALAKVEVYMENEAGELVLVQTIEGEDLKIENGKLYISIPSKDGYQKVKVIAYDAAGNAVESDEYSVLVNASQWKLFVARKPLFYGTIFAILAVIAFIFFIIWKRRKDEEEEEEGKPNTAAK